jgi:hypothetical protein
MSKEESFDGTVEDDDFDFLVGFERGDNLIQLRNALGTENVERWMVQRHSPVLR